MRTVLVAALLVAGCASSSSETKGPAHPTSQKSLYDRLGGKDAITAVVDNFVGRVAADQRINARFANTDIPHFKVLLVEQICQESGGPCKYSGKDMKASHAGMAIRDEEFTALVEDLQAALVELKVPEAEQKDLVGALGPMKGDIVGQ